MICAAVGVVRLFTVPTPGGAVPSGSVNMRTKPSSKGIQKKKSKKYSGVPLVFLRGREKKCTLYRRVLMHKQNSMLRIVVRWQRREQQQARSMSSLLLRLWRYGLCRGCVWICTIGSHSKFRRADALLQSFCFPSFKAGKKKMFFLFFCEKMISLRQQQWNVWWMIVFHFNGWRIFFLGTSPSFFYFQFLFLQIFNLFFFF